jgi:hypothetical protein
VSWGWAGRDVTGWGRLRWGGMGCVGMGCVGVGRGWVGWSELGWGWVVWDGLGCGGVGLVRVEMGWDGWGGLLWSGMGWGDSGMGSSPFLPCAMRPCLYYAGDNFLRRSNDRNIKKGPMNDCWPVLEYNVLYTEELDKLWLFTKA